MKKIIITTLFVLFYFLPINLKAEIKTISEGNTDAKIKMIIFEFHWMNINEKSAYIEYIY